MKWITGILLVSIAAQSLAAIRGPVTLDVEDAFHPLSDKMIDHINHYQPSWKAGRNFNPNVSMAYIHRLMGALEEPWFIRLPQRKPHRLQGLHIPKEFDARTKWPNCPSMNEIRDQGSCGSCWAFAATEAMTDRYCVFSKGTKQFRFSAENLLGCCKIINLCGMGCNGGWPAMAWRYFRRNGLVSGGPYGSNQGCQPYEIPPCEHHAVGPRINCTESIYIPPCTAKCEASYPVNYKDDLHYGKESYAVSRDVEQIQVEIMKNGPVGGAFQVYTDFLSYKSGVYHRVAGSYVGGHAIKIIGWGEDNGVQYWTVANSWNYDWGDKGFFRILRGHNECGIEGSIQAGTPIIK